jgi:hypothetical protein
VVGVEVAQSVPTNERARLACGRLIQDRVGHRAVGYSETAYLLVRKLLAEEVRLAFGPPSRPTLVGTVWGSTGELHDPVSTGSAHVSLRA